MNIKDRMESIRHHYDLTVQQFEKLCGFSNGSWAKAQEIKETGILKFIDAFPNVNSDWLLKGEGEMLLDCSQTIGEVKKQTTATCENEWERRTQLLHQNNVTQIIALCHKLVDNYQQQNNTIAQLANLLEQLDNNTRQHEPLRETTPQTNNTPEM